MPPKSKQPGNARYVVHLPTHDAHGNLLQDLSPASHEWLASQIPKLVRSIHTEGPHAGHRTPWEFNRHLHVLAQDSPEADSYVKQLAAHVGDAGNHQSVFVSKDGQRGPESWEIPNRNYDGGPARPEAIAFQSAPQPLSAPPIPSSGEIPSSSLAGA